MSQLLIVAVLHNAIKEYLYPHTILSSNNKNAAQDLAKQFIFNDNYLLDWGDISISPEELLSEANLDINNVRDKVLKKLNSPNYSGIYTKGEPLI